MASIVLTNKCNLQCPYCFAGMLTAEGIKYFTVEDFIKALNFIKTTPGERLGIVGGEPTIHPKLGEFIKIINNDNDIHHCIMFTNGIELEKYIDLLSEKFALLINCNTPENLGSSFSKLENSIKQLVKAGMNRFTLGINLYKLDMDFDYIFELLKAAGHKSVRFSSAISAYEKINSENMLDTLRKYNDILLRFSEACIKHEIIPSFDCGSVPPFCIRDINLKRAQLKLNEIAKKYHDNSNIFGMMHCGAQIDILPDLTAVRSICFPYYEGVHIDKFENINQMKQYFYDEIDSYMGRMYASEECKECIYRKRGQCSICMCFFMKQFKKLKEEDRLSASVKND